MKKLAERPRRMIAPLLAVGFGTVSVVAVIMCGILLGIIFNVSQLISGMRDDEGSIRQGLELATAVRELSLHIAHSIIEGDDSHLAQYEQWREQTRSRLQEIAAVVSEDEEWRVRELGDTTQRMHDMFMMEAMPAARRGDVAEARRLHRDIEVLARAASAHADALAQSVESNMAHSHMLATDATHLGLLVGGLCVILVVGLSIGFTIRLRAALFKPLVALTDAARRYGRGDFALRVGEIGQGELGALAQTFDRMAEELSRRETRMLQHERMAAIGQLAAGVAHELNNPIGIIRGYLRTMTPDSDPATLQEELAILDEEAGHCQRIAADLLAYARTEELTLDRIEMRAFLEETAKRFGESPAAHGAATKGAMLVVEADEAQLDGDGPRIRQVLLNLLSNASQATVEASTYALRGAEDGADYRIEVEDHGPGIPIEDRQRIFEPFFSKRRGGSGLGLSVCSGIVKAHRGTIEVTDNPEGGTIFVVRLPLEQMAPASSPSEMPTVSNAAEVE